MGVDPGAERVTTNLTALEFHQESGHESDQTSWYLKIKKTLSYRRGNRIQVAQECGS